MKRQLFLVSGASLAAVAAGCGHGAGFVPNSGTAGTPGAAMGSGPRALYSASDQDRYFAARPLPANPILGEVRRFDGVKAPTGWAFCDGSALSVALYPALYKLLVKPTTHNKNTPTFNLPKTERFTMVIAVTGETPSRPRDLEAILNARPHRYANADGTSIH